MEQVSINFMFISQIQQMCKKCFLTRLGSILRNGYGITNNCSRAPHDYFMANEIW